MSKHSQILTLARQLVEAIEASAPAPRKKTTEPKAPDVSASSDAEVKKTPPKPPRKPAAKKAPSPPVVPEPSA